MKVLFAVSNDNVSSSIIKKYQEKYKEIITSKNVYYFNAIIKELQKDKTYDAVVIGEDLEPISNNNYDTIDKFIFDKLDNISDEAYKATGEDIPIILICSDRRTKSDVLLIKLFGIGIYNALLGNDRNIDMVCNLINKPRSKKEAKNYYKVDSEDVSYRPENESEVSETEIKNILNHYKKIGNNEKKCVESFESIASQYNDTQLRIIVKFLPNQVKQILENSSSRYQNLVNGGTVLTSGKYTPYTPKAKDVKKHDTDFLTKDIEKPNLTKPVIIPSTMNIDTAQVKPIQKSIPRSNTTKVVQSQPEPVEFAQTQTQVQPQPRPVESAQTQVQSQSRPEESIQTPAEPAPVVATVKRRGRPKKINVEASTSSNTINNSTAEPLMVNNADQVINNETQTKEVAPVKRGRGRPKKVNNIAEDLEKNNTTTMLINTPSKALAEQNSFNLFDLGSNEENFNNNSQNSNEQKAEQINDTETVNLFELNDVQEQDSVYEQNNYNNQFAPSNNFNAQEPNNVYEQNNYNAQFNPSNDYDAQELNNVYEQNNYNAQFNPSNDYNAQELNNVYEQNNYNAQFNPSNDYNAQEPNNVYEQNYNTQLEQPNYFEMSNTQELSRTSKDSNVVQSNFVAQNKIVAFVGTSKNGTSFIVNNIAELLAQKGIKTAILDLTKNKNSYYMFTDNDQKLMQLATQSIKNLERGIAAGVEVNKNLTVYTSLPGEDDETENFEAILQTLDNNYSAILMDCDFETNINYFAKATEVYLVQSMDALTIQPLTLFLSNLKLKNVLDETKLRVIINKEVKLKILNDKMILGGMAKYNEPSMTLQRDLFNPATIKYVTIPFEMQTYARYLEAIALCQISLSGYSQTFLASLEKLANMVYPLVSSSGYTNYSPNYENVEKRGFFKSKNKKQPPTQFSTGVNDTLNKMRSNY